MTPWVHFKPHPQPLLSSVDQNILLTFVKILYDLDKKSIFNNKAGFFKGSFLPVDISRKASLISI